jgi:hypothetical protein
MVEKLQPAKQMSGNGRRELLPARKSKLKSNGPCGTSGAVRDANRHDMCISGYQTTTREFVGQLAQLLGTPGDA